MRAAAREIPPEMKPLKLTEDDLTLVFPEPETPLIDDPGPTVPWSEFMDRIAARTRRYLRHHPPAKQPEEPLPDERFVLED